MPELPEVDAITGVAARYAVLNRLVAIDVMRPSRGYFSGKAYDWRGGARVESVSRMGKYVVFEFQAHWGPDYLVVHNAMTGYFDWEHEPWTFDYVESARESNDSDVRVRFAFKDGKVLRFHDTRLFGRMQWQALPVIGPELMETPNMMVGRPVITRKQFAERILADRRPIKAVITDQGLVCGIGNIYANEALHVAGIDPRTPGQDLMPAQVPLLLEALKCVVSHSIPKVTYDWLDVYRRAECGTCGGQVIRVEVAKRATFICEKCQGVP